jgi:hypothetical protein
LCEAKQNGGFFPLNKNLYAHLIALICVSRRAHWQLLPSRIRDRSIRWSPSFIFATAAMAFFLLATFYLLIDVFHLWNGSPFRFIGAALLSRC